MNSQQLIDPFSLAHDWQLPVLQDRRRFVVAVAKRRRGKTTLGALRLWLGAETRPGVYLCVASSKQALLNCRDRFLAVVPFDSASLCWVGLSGPCVLFANGSKIFFTTEDDVLEGRFRGRQLDGVVIDEFLSSRRGTSLGLVLRPALADRGGWALVTGSPLPSWGPVMKRLRLVLRLAAMRDGFDPSSVGIHVCG